MKYPPKKQVNWPLLVILFLAALLRFGGLSWCLPYSPHPDEWNMAAAITRLDWKGAFDPKFYAYGQFPLYLSYFSATLYNSLPWIKIQEINIQEATFFLRFWSALAGVGTVYLVYLISKKLTPTTHPRHFDFAQCKLATHNPQLTPLLASLLAAFTPGLVQISHFGTTESFLSFFFLLALLLSFAILEKKRLKYYLFAGIILGLAIGTKISGLLFAFPIFLVFLIQFLAVLKNENRLKNTGQLFLKNFVFLVSLVLLVLLSSPYLVLAFKASRSTLLYETSVATGTSPVFYTRQFINTTPVLFQLQKIFPYALGWPIFIFGTGGFLIALVCTLKKVALRKKLLPFDLNFCLLTFAFLTYFSFQAFLFCKWTRFIAPVLALFPIFSALTFNIIVLFLKSRKKFAYLLICLFAYLSIIPGIIFSSVYFSPDIRFTASEWIYKNIPSNSQILFDTGNVLDIPISPPNYQLPITNYSLVSFDFYHLDENPELFSELLHYLETSDYIIVPSRRIFANHLRIAEKYPKTAKYYQLLFSGKLGFVQIAKIEPFYSKIFKDEEAEETFTVFDHPTIRIYRKNVNLTKTDYENLFQ